MSELSSEGIHKVVSCVVIVIYYQFLCITINITNVYSPPGVLSYFNKTYALYIMRTLPPWEHAGLVISFKTIGLFAILSKEAENMTLPFNIQVYPTFLRENDKY